MMLVIYVLWTDSISYNDFCDIMRKEKPLNKDSLLKAFKCIDKNGDGFITYDELFTLLTKVCSLAVSYLLLSFKINKKMNLCC